MSRYSNFERTREHSKFESEILFRDLHLTRDF